MQSILAYYTTVHRKPIKVKTVHLCFLSIPHRGNFSSKMAGQYGWFERPLLFTCLIENNDYKTQIIGCWWLWWFSKQFFSAAIQVISFKFVTVLQNTYSEGPVVANCICLNLNDFIAHEKSNFFNFL